VARQKLLKSDLGKWLDGIAQECQLIGPREDEGVVCFLPVESSAALTQQFANSLIPPKNLFFPQVESLFSFRKASGGIELEATRGSDKERVLFGIRNCDVRALSLLDAVFGGDPADAYYQDRRARTTLIALACPVPPRPGCFCTSFGIDPLSPEGSDVLLTEADAYYLVDVSTEKGERLVGSREELFTPVSDDEARELAPLPVEMEELDLGLLRERIDTMWEDDLWRKLGLSCLGCGICTYVCPTCHCFDMLDVGSRAEGERYRCWDSCMYGDFTLMASGVNPRPTKRERIRNRFFHKFSFFPSRYEAGYACVGCGRCMVHCPGGVEITEVIKSILAKESVNE
jgi:sulfhydrogenase subunit beta (sulfur reductase)